MTRRVGSGDLFAVKSDGSIVKPDEDGEVTLEAATYYFPIVYGSQGVESIHIKTDAAIAATFTIETSNFPKYKGDAGGETVDVSDYSATAGDWVQENDSNAYIASSGTGWTVTAMTLAKTAGTGGAIIQLGNLAARRLRIKAVVTTPGNVRVNNYGREGS